MSKSTPVSIRLLDREYTVGCEPDERDSLLAAAKLLDTLDRVAVLAALNVAHELQQLRDENSGRDRELSRTLGDLNRRLDDLFDAPAR